MKTLALLALSIGMAQAQDTTLTYQGSLMTGTATTFNPGGSLTAQPFTGAYSILLVFHPFTSQPHYWSLVSYSFAVVGPDPININIGPQPLGVSGNFQTSFCGSEGCVMPTFSNGAMTGATVDLNNSAYHSDNSQVIINAIGDSFSFTHGDNNGLCGGSSTPPTSFIPNCQIGAGSTHPGVWSVNGVPQINRTPEIDPSSAASGLTLLFGALAVLRSKRREPSDGGGLTENLAA